MSSCNRLFIVSFMLVMSSIDGSLHACDMSLQVSSTAVLSKKAVNAILVKNEMTTFYGFLHRYLTLCKARKPYLHSKVVKIANQKGRICKTPMVYNRKRPYVHTVFLSGMFLQLRLSSLYSCCRYGFLDQQSRDNM